MIKVNGIITYKLKFELEIHMTEDEWDDMSSAKQNEWIDENIGYDEMKSAEMDDCDVWDIVTIEKEE